MPIPLARRVFIVVAFNIILIDRATGPVMSARSTAIASATNMQNFLIPSEDARPRNYKVPLLKRRTICNQILAVCAFVVIVIFVSVWHRNRPEVVAIDRCAVSNELIQPIRSRSLALDGSIGNDNNTTVLTNIAGFVETFVGGDREGYLNLDFDEIYHDKLYNGPFVVTLQGQCTRLQIKYSARHIDEAYFFEGIELYIKKKVHESHMEKFCEFKPQFVLQQPKSERYSCLHTRYHACVHGGQLLASLVLSKFELELDGDRYANVEGKFSKSPTAQSCKLWQNI
jgi:hypothetical protein